jgi:uncharacterized membrane protein
MNPNLELMKGTEYVWIESMNILMLLSHIFKFVFKYRVIINYCTIVVGVENPHKFWMCRQPRNVRQTSRQISTTASIATSWRY